MPLSGGLKAIQRKRAGLSESVFSLIQHYRVIASVNLTVNNRDWEKPRIDTGRANILSHLPDFSRSREFPPSINDISRELGGSKNYEEYEHEKYVMDRFI